MPPPIPSPIVQQYQQILRPHTGELDQNMIKIVYEDGRVMFIAGPRSGAIPNAEWEQYQAWLKEGNKPDPPDPVQGASGKLANVPISSDDPLARLEQRVTQLEQDNG